jgi:hypothetical protein
MMKMENLLWLLAWHGAAMTFAAVWTAPLWARDPDRREKHWIPQLEQQWGEHQ